MFKKNKKKFDWQEKELKKKVVVVWREWEQKWETRTENQKFLKSFELSRLFRGLEEKGETITHVQQLPPSANDIVDEPHEKKAQHCVHARWIELKCL